METPKEKSLELERLVFFSDAVVAIAITLLALDLKLEHEGPTLTAHDIRVSWPHFLAFFLSFVIIGLFWKIHHQFFVHIQRVDEKMLGFNMAWLFFLAVIPFSTNLLSAHLDSRTAAVVYCANVLFISFSQNMIWDYACQDLIIVPGWKVKADAPLLRSTTTDETINIYRTACNLQMANALLALVLAFFWPTIALVVLFSRIFFFRTPAVQWISRKLTRANAFQQKDARRKERERTPPKG